MSDSAALNARDIAWQNRRRQRQGKSLLAPLYSLDDVNQTMKQFVGHKYREVFSVCPGVSVRFLDAGHILGSAIVELTLSSQNISRKLIFSGDLGQYNTPILHDPEFIESADVVLMENTYAGRKHRNREQTHEEIGAIISAAKGRGNILIPAFSIGRSQEILYLLGQNYVSWDMHHWQVFLDSPMAIEASKVYWNYPHLYDDDATKFRRAIFEMPTLNNLHLTATPEQSMLINNMESGGIIIAGNGMCSGGRILHHLKRNLWRSQAQVMIVGYQSPGSLGRQLVDGEPYVKIHGDQIKVNAKIHTVGGLSAHADEADLDRWLDSMAPKPKVYLVHGSKKRSEQYAFRLRQRNIDANVARSGEILDLVNLSSQ